jgi:hypothetical protein
MIGSDQDAEWVVKRYDQLEGERGTWESHWAEIAERVLPRYHNTMQRSTLNITPGEKRTEKMFDATASLALERFAAAMESMLTPRNQKWHHLRSTNEDLNKVREVKLYFEEVNNRLFKERYSPKSNFASQQHEVYIGLGAFGTSALFSDYHDGGGLRYKAIDLRELLFDMSHQGVVDTSYRKFVLTARQMQQRVDAGRWDTIPEEATAALKEHPDKQFEIIHCVRPNGEMDPARKDYKGKPYASTYVAVESRTTLSRGGFNTFPYSVTRYVTGPGELYGRSPAMLALPAIKVLNEQKKTMLKQGHRTVDPILLSHDDGVLDGLSLKPGALNPGGVSAEGRALVHTLPVGNLAAGQELMDMERTVINDAFLVTLFQILVDTPAMTATEVLERAREKGALLSPTMGRQQSEGQGPQIERDIDLLQSQGRLPEMPDVLREADGEYEIQYDSPLSRSQRSEEAAGWLRTLEAAIAYANTTQDVSVLDQFDTDIIYPALAEINAVPATWMRGQDAVDQMREQRAKQQQAQQMIDAAPAAAGMMKAVQ